MVAQRVRGGARSSVGKALEETRKGLGWSLRKAESESSVSNGYISQIERGDVEPSPEVLRKLGGAYGIPYAVLLESAGYVTKRDDTKDPGKVPAFVFSAAESMDEQDWRAAQAFFRALISMKKEGGSQ